MAKAEGISADELEDAIQLLASRYPVTADEVIAVVEEHGLEGANEQIGMAASRG